MTSLWTQKHNWTDPFLVTYSFRTEVLASRSGKEQRRSLQSQPRRSFDFSLLAKGRAARDITYTLSRALRESVLAPEITEFVELALASEVGADTIEVTEVRPWLTVGANVMITDGSTSAVMTVESVAGISVVFTTALDRPWPRGARVVVMRLGLLNPEADLTLNTDDVLSGSVSFSVDPGSEKFDIAPPEGLVFDGREVFPFRFNWADPVGLAATYQRNVVDYEFGARRSYSRVADRVVSFSGNSLCASREEAQAVVNFFVRMKGQRGEFLMPSPHTDLALETEVTSGLVELPIVGDFEKVFDVDGLTRVLQVQAPQGWTYFRKIVSAARDGDTTIVEIEQDIPLDLVPNQCRVSVVLVSRLASDELIMEWITDSVARVQLTTQSVPYAASEEPVSEFDEGTQWLIDYYGWVFVRDVFADPLQRIVNDLIPRFALLLDEAGEYMIETYGRYRSRVYIADPVDRVVNTVIPNFAEI